MAPLDPYNKVHYCLLQFDQPLEFVLSARARHFGATRLFWHAWRNDGDQLPVDSGQEPQRRVSAAPDAAPQLAQLRASVPRALALQVRSNCSTALADCE